LEKHRFVHALLAVESVIGAPVLLLAAAQTDEIGEGGFFRTEQNREHVLLETPGATFPGSGHLGRLQHLPEFVAQERGFVFF
jgi:hypothetical protein